jgi:hypothetical protein
VPIDDAEMDKIDRALAKYKPLDIARPKKTLLQAHPLDFANVENAEVYLIDIVTGLPASSYVLQQELRNVLNCPEKYIVVRAPNEPIELNSEQLAADREMDADAREKGLSRKSFLSTDSEYRDPSEEDSGAHDAYGNEYNIKLLDYLYAIQKSRKSMEKEPANSLFSWMDLPKESAEPKQVDGDFNADMDGVEPASTRKVAKKPINPGDVKSRSIQGNFDDNGKKYTRSYVDGKGKVSSKEVTTPNSIRKGK